MSRVTPDEVKELASTTLDDTVIQIWIDVANSVVNKNAACIGGDEDLLTKIELQLSAHYVLIESPSTKGPVSKTKLGPMETTYAVSSQEKGDLYSTANGRAANMLAGGCLDDYMEDVATVDFF